MNRNAESLIQRIEFDDEKSIQLNNDEALKDPSFELNQDALLARNVVNQAGNVLSFCITHRVRSKIFNKDIIYH